MLLRKNYMFKKYKNVLECNELTINFLWSFCNGVYWNLEMYMCIMIKCKLFNLDFSFILLFVLFNAHIILPNIKIATDVVWK